MKKKPKFRKKRRQKGRRRIVILTAVLLLFVSITWYCMSGLHSIIFVYAKSMAETVMSDTANQAVFEIMKENGITYQDIVQVTRGDDNIVSALEIDTVLVNQLKAQITTEISKLLASKEKLKIEVPLGSLLENEFLWGMGPTITFNMDITGTILSDFRSHFESAGINQTLHQIVVEVGAQAHIVMPLYRKTCEVKTSFIVAQTVIVGKVPEAYTYVFDDDREDIVGDIFDYGASVG